MKNALVLAGIGLGLFAATIVLLLGLQGRLNRAGLASVPLLGALVPADGPAAPSDSQAPATPAAPGGETTSGIGLEREKRLPYGIGESVLKPREGQKQGAETPPPVETPPGELATPPDPESAPFRRKLDELLGQGQYSRGRLFEFPRLESGIGVDELNEMLRNAQKAQQAIEQERAALKRKEDELRAREDDVRDRYEAVARQMQEVEAKRGELEARIEQFHNEVILVQPADEKGLKEFARTLAALEPKTARDVVLTMWKEGQEGQTRVLKIWSVMAADAGHQILKTMDPGQIREILEKRLSVLRAQPPASK